MRNNQGFTLMEIMLVVVIIGILASIAGITIVGRVDQSKREAARTQLKNFDVALDLFALDMGDYPAKLDDLVKAPSGDKNWNGPYLKNMTFIPQDPWGGKYQFDKATKGYTLFSAGKDGRPNTDDDIKPIQLSANDNV